MEGYKQFDIIWTQFPLSDKVDKLKVRPAVIVSNENSNGLDNDILVCPITSKIRGDAFAVLLTDEMVTDSLDIESEIRCNKIMTIRSILVVSKIGEILPAYQERVLDKINRAFEILP